MKSRRAALDRTEHSSSTHAGLWLDKYLNVDYASSGQDQDTEAKKKLVQQVAGCTRPPDYLGFFEQWEDALVDATFTQRACIATTTRVVVGLGGESVLETHLTLHRTYGVPYLPGSALKGLASSFAHRFLPGDGWRKGGELHTELFGDTALAGAVDFLDALPHSYQMHPDVITVHHPNYYLNGQEPPADWDSPNPVGFIAVTGQFLLALRGPEDWVQVALQILQRALSQEGIGAKTSSGYGRFDFRHMAAATDRFTKKPQAKAEPKPPSKDLPPSPPPSPSGYPDEGKALDLLAFFNDTKPSPRRASLIKNPGQEANNVQNYKCSPQTRRALAQAYLDFLHREVKTGFDGKPWFAKIKGMLEG